MERGFLILLLAVFAELFFLRSRCERPSPVGGGVSDPRTAHLGVATAGVPISQMDKYFAKWQPGQDHTEANRASEIAGDSNVNGSPDPEDNILPSGAGRTQSEDSDEEDEEEIPFHLNADQILNELGHSYDPLGGKMDVLLKQVKTSDGEAHRNSKHWVDRSHQAIKAAHHLTAESSHDAQSELMKDGLRLDEAIRGNWKNETAKMYALSLDPSIHSRIHLEVNTRRKLTPRQREAGEDERILIPPPATPDALIGKRVLCNNYYEGENADIVRGHYAVVTAYDPHVLKYRVRLKHWMGKDFMPLLKHSEFELMPGEELDSVEVDELRPPTERTTWADSFPGPVGGVEQDQDKRISPEWLAAMDTYGEKPVLIHHLPKHLTDEAAFDKDKYLNNLGTVVDYRHVSDNPEFRIKMDKEEADLRMSLRDAERPWLTLDRDFNFVLELKGKEIQVVLPGDGTRGTQSYKLPIEDKGTVRDWHPEDGGFYDVNVAAHEAKVKPAQIEHLDGLGYIPPSDEEVRKRMTKRKIETTAKFGAGFHDAKFSGGGKKLMTQAPERAG